MTKIAKQQRRYIVLHGKCHRGVGGEVCVCVCGGGSLVNLTEMENGEVILCVALATMLVCFERTRENQILLQHSKLQNYPKTTHILVQINT